MNYDNKVDKMRLRNYVSLLPTTISSEMKVLDIGCGKGSMIKFLKKKDRCEVWGLDIKRPESTEWVESLKKDNIYFIFYDLTLTKRSYLPFKDECFDLIIFTEVLEHLIMPHPPYNLFKELKRILKNNGVLLLSTPNIAELAKRIRLLFGRHSVPRLQSETEFYAGHYGEYTLEELTYVMSRVGFNIDRVMFKNYATDNYFRGNNLIKLLYNFILKLYSRFKTTIMIVAKEG